MSDHEIEAAAPRRRANREVHGVLVVDKPHGPTSHDIVARLRRALGTRAIGHAGTLDPAATGVLVLAIGEGTKLSPYLTAHDKSYVATVAFGRMTTTLDAEGEVTEERPIPEELAAALDRLARGEAVSGILARALDAEMVRTEQIPPAFSAIKQQGRPVHERARSGEAIELPPRPVALRSMEILGVEENRLTLALRVSKGFYVRSFARDLGDRLGVPAHLASLRRTASGPFSLAEAIDPTSTPGVLIEALLPLPVAACRALPCSRLTEEGTIRARQGKRLGSADFLTEPPRELSAWLAPNGTLVAIGEPNERGELAVRRGFVELRS